jgi:hypothetical protein
MQCRGSGSVVVPINSPNLALALLKKCVVDHIMNGVVVKALHSHVVLVLTLYFFLSSTLTAVVHEQRHFHIKIRVLHARFMQLVPASAT